MFTEKGTLSKHGHRMPAWKKEQERGKNKELASSREGGGGVSSRVTLRSWKKGRYHVVDQTEKPIIVTKMKRK